MAVVGSQLLQPEAGTKRYDSTAGAFAIGAGWAAAADNSAYMGSYYINNTTTSPISFSFTGTTFRIIGARNTTGGNSIKVSIDGVTETFSANGPLAYSVLLYEKTGLEDKKHTVSVYREDGYMWFDAVDISSPGRLYHPDEVTDSRDLTIGKRIRCHYNGGLNTFGSFTGLGVETSDFIPVTAAPSGPDGDFYFIMVDDYNGEIRLIPDRNIQSSISWNTLNIAGLSSTTGIELAPKALVSAIPVMTSNVSEYGKASASSIYSTAADAWRAFDKTTAGWLMASNQYNGAWIRYDFNKPKVIKGYSITGGTDYMSSDYMKSWRFEASNDDGSTWVVLDTKSGYTFGNLERKDFQITNDTLYTSYRIVITGGGGGAYVRTSEIDFLEETDQIKGRVRLMTGGYSGSDTNNEWDRYIVNSSLNGKIIPGDNNVWNWSGKWSLTSTTNSFGTSYRTVRGSGAANGSSYVVATEASPNNENLRPMFILTQKYTNKYLIQDGSDIKVVDGVGWKTVGSAPVTEEMYLAYGMDSLTPITDTLMDQLRSSVVQILSWTDMINATEREIDVSATPLARVVLPEGDISLPIQGFSDITISAQATNEADLKIMASVDSGQSWKTYSGSAWVSVNLTSLSEAKDKGMTAATFNNLTEAQWKQLVSGALKIRFAYYLDNDARIDEINITPKSYTNATPTVVSIKATFDEMTVEGRLKDLEKLNAINFAKLNFKANALIKSEKYAMHDMIVDTCQAGEMNTVVGGVIVTQPISFTTPSAMGSGFYSEFEITNPNTVSKVMII